MLTFLVDEKPSKRSALKRIGTVMSRRKSTAPSAPTPEKRKDRPRFPFRRGESRSFQDLDSPPRSSSGLTPVVPQSSEQSTRPSQTQFSSDVSAQVQIDRPHEGPMTNGNLPSTVTATSSDAVQTKSEVSCKLLESGTYVTKEVQTFPSNSTDTSSQAMALSDPSTRAQQEASATTG